MRVFWRERERGRESGGQTDTQIYRKTKNDGRRVCERREINMPTHF